MSERLTKRDAIFTDYIRQLRDTADDPGLNNNWKIVVISGILKELERALAAADEEETA